MPTNGPNWRRLFCQFERQKKISGYEIRVITPTLEETSSPSGAQPHDTIPTSIYARGKGIEGERSSVLNVYRVWDQGRFLLDNSRGVL